MQLQQKADQLGYSDLDLPVMMESDYGNLGDPV
jgi:hypothetical protein